MTRRGLDRRRRWATGLALVAAAALVVGACDDDRRAISRDDLPNVPDEPTVTVHLGDDGFDPETLTVTTGDLIAVEISGDGHGIYTEDHHIDSGPLFDGETTRLMFPDADDYVLIDLADESETLSVQVTDVDG